VQRFRTDDTLHTRLEGGVPDQDAAAARTVSHASRLFCQAAN
jgi:hypothetical protein